MFSSHPSEAMVNERGLTNTSPGNNRNDVRRMKESGFSLCHKPPLQPCKALAAIVKRYPGLPKDSLKSRLTLRFASRQNAHMNAKKKLMGTDKL